MSRRKREPPKARQLRKALEGAGHTRVRVWWEPIGPALEMCGHSGGYMFTSREQQSPSLVPLGLSLAEALVAVRLWRVQEAA